MSGQSIPTTQNPIGGQVPQMVRPQPGPQTFETQKAGSAGVVQGQVMDRAGGLAQQPYPNVPMRSPVVPPGNDQILVGYELVAPITGCCKCNDLTPLGMFLLVFFAIFFSCLAWVPCVVASFHQQTQRPVYGLRS